MLCQKVYIKVCQPKLKDTLETNKNRRSIALKGVYIKTIWSQNVGRETEHIDLTKLKLHSVSKVQRKILLDTTQQYFFLVAKAKLAKYKKSQQDVSGGFLMIQQNF